jgi:gluconolactonase
VSIGSRRIFLIKSCRIAARKYPLPPHGNPEAEMVDYRVIASGLLFPEGPVAMPDGSVVLVEIVGGKLSRIRPDGTKEIIANTGGGPNGAAIGPDGTCYLCNNGGVTSTRVADWVVPGEFPDHCPGGLIQRVDLATGRVESLYTHVGDVELSAPNDLVFDDQGGFWFTDFGQNRARSRARGGIYYAKADGSFIEEAVFPLESPNGIGVSPDGKTVYVAETYSGNVWSFRLSAPGKIDRSAGAYPNGGTLLGRAGPHWYLDSLAVDSAGNICVAGAGRGGILVFAPDGSTLEEISLPDPLTTNICFGGPDLRTAYVTGGTGQLIAFEWPRPGLKLNYLG